MEKPQVGEKVPVTDNSPSQFCEDFGKINKRQMRARERRSAMNAAAIFVQQVHKIWENKKIAGALLTDVKGAFDHISGAELAKKCRS